MILYFTGSGNTKFVADCLADKLADQQVVSLNALLKDGAALTFESADGKPFVVCFPIYAWGIPGPVEALLNRASFKGAKDIYFVATMGANSGRTDKRCEALAAKLGLSFKGFRGIVMPDNYIVWSPAKTPEQAHPVIAAGMSEACEIAAAIASRQTICRTDTTSMGGLKSSLVHDMFTKHGSDTKDYMTTSACTLCGTCVALCPLNNISLEVGDEAAPAKVVFGNNCTACYACLHRCPQQAIEIKGKTEGKGRYVCPSYAGFEA